MISAALSLQRYHVALWGHLRCSPCRKPVSDSEFDTATWFSSITNRRGRGCLLPRMSNNDAESTFRKVTTSFAYCVWVPFGFHRSRPFCRGSSRLMKWHVSPRTSEFRSGATQAELDHIPAYHNITGDHLRILMRRRSSVNFLAYVEVYLCTYMHVGKHPLSKNREWKRRLRRKLFCKNITADE